MQKTTKCIVLSLAAFIFIVITNSYVFGGTTITTDWPISNGETVGNVEVVVQRIWVTAELIVQILAVAAVVFAGLRYMFSTPDVRAEIKKQLGILVLGAILVFSTTLVIDFIVKSTEEVL